MARLRPAFLLVLALLACTPISPEPKSECSTPADCDELLSAPCTGCAQGAATLCAEGTCEGRGADAVDVVVDINIDRAIDGAQGLLYVVADGRAGEGAFSCDELADSPSAGWNVLSSGAKNLLGGGDLHLDLALGRVPEGSAGIAVWVTDGASGTGDVIGQGCAAGLSASPPTLDAGRIDVDK